MAVIWMPAFVGMTGINYFFAVFISSVVYQIGDDHARSWIVNGMPSGTGIPVFNES